MKKILFVFLCFFSLLEVLAQSSNYNRYKYQQAQSVRSSNGFDPARLTFGGSFGLQFGDYTTINVAPQVGYSFNKYINAGVGLAYTYYKDDYYFNNYKIKDSRSYFGINLYAKLYPVDFLVFTVQPEANRMWSTIKEERTSAKYTENKFVPAVVVGGGLRFGPVTAMLKYDVVQDENSPYGNNVFYSVGYTFGW